MPPVRPLAALLFLAIPVTASHAQAAAEADKSPVSEVFSYAALMRTLMAAPVVAIVDVDRATPLKGAQAAGVAPGFARLYVEATVATLIRGANGLPTKITYLADVRTDSANRPPKLRRQRMILLAAPVAERPAELRLAGPGGQIAWSAPEEARVRAALAELLATNAPPPITGISGAFHVPGSLPGESETQVFLRTAAGRPISLSILRRPGEQPRWAVSLTEMVDNSAAPPARDTLLWYRLACGLPATLPDTALASIAEADRAATQADYRLVVDGLGPCR